jgi:iron complex outermembrane receptor protein
VNCPRNSTFGERYTVVAGAENVFDAYPDEAQGYPDFSFGVRYPESSPIGYNGGFWYLRLQAEF